MHAARLPENVYIADATPLLSALGNPPILTIVAVAKRVARAVVQRQLVSWSRIDDLYWAVHPPSTKNSAPVT
jgi:choline dehydrogenase-like flavoprotein